MYPNTINGRLKFVKFENNTAVIGIKRDGDTRALPDGSLKPILRYVRLPKSITAQFAQDYEEIVFLNHPVRVELRLEASLEEALQANQTLLAAKLHYEQ